MHINTHNFPLNWFEYESATDDWLHGFMNHHKDLSLKMPEAINRTASYNGHNINHLFQNIKSLFNWYNLGPDQIWYRDETIVHKSKEIVSYEESKNS